MRKPFFSLWRLLGGVFLLFFWGMSFFVVDLFVVFLSLLPSIFALSGKLKLIIANKLIMCLHTRRCWSTHHHLSQPPLGKTIEKVLKWNCSVLVCGYEALCLAQSWIQRAATS